MDFCDMLVFPCPDGGLLAGYTGDTDNVTLDSNVPTEKSRQVMFQCLLDFVPAVADATVLEHRTAVLANPLEGGPVHERLAGWQNVYLALTGDAGIASSPFAGYSIARLIEECTRPLP